MRVALLVPALSAIVAGAGCTSEYHPEYHPQSSYSVQQTVSYPTTVLQVGVAGPLEVVAVPPPPPPVAATEAQPLRDPSEVLVLESGHLDRPAEVVGIVDILAGGTHAATVSLLRRRGAEMGADAVVGLERHPGDGEGRPARISGLAVRFAQGRIEQNREAIAGHRP